MRPGVVVLPEPVIDDGLSLLGRCEARRIQNLSPYCPIEPLVVPVLPCPAQQGIARRCPERGDPGQMRIGAMPTRRSQPCMASAAHAGPSVIGSDTLWGTAAQHERIECFESIVGPHLGADHNGQGLPRDFVETRQHLVAAPIAGLVVDEVPSRRSPRNRLPGNGILGVRWFRPS